MCRKVFEAKRAPSVAGPYRDPDDPDQRHFYHCPRCNFDVCSVCFKGHVHNFHRHRLKKARATIVYPDALWRCDACRTVHSEHTDQLCYHCEKCEVDLCTLCFEGKWDHFLHSGMSEEHEHTLKPVNTRIEYRTYQEWTCDNCGRVFSCQLQNTAFHCSNCSYDLCETCFNGEKHHLHPHPLVAIESAKGSTSMLECSNCEKPLAQTTHYHCKKRSCHYYLCVNCFSKQPERHPYHSHPLHVCDPLVVYPQSGGLWHCDNCTSKSVNRQPQALSSTEIMYHCEKCDYDLCHGCYAEGLARSSARQREMFRPVQVTEEVSYTPSVAPEPSFDSSGYGTYQPQTNYYTSQDYHTRLSGGPLVTGFHSFLPQVPPHRLCIICHRSEATTTFLHRGVPHSGHGICCYSCAYDVVSNRRPCPACRIPPDDIFQPPR